MTRFVRLQREMKPMMPAKNIGLSGILLIVACVLGFQF